MVSLYLHLPKLNSTDTIGCRSRVAFKEICWVVFSGNKHANGLIMSSLYVLCVTKASHLRRNFVLAGSSFLRIVSTFRSLHELAGDGGDTWVWTMNLPGGWYGSALVFNWVDLIPRSKIAVSEISSQVHNSGVSQ